MSLFRRLTNSRTRHPRDVALTDAVLLAIVIIVIGTIGYAVIEGWSFTDALYATIITITTVGYGDMVPTTTGGRIFAIVFTLFAISAAGYTLSALAAGIIERNQSRREESIRKRQIRRMNELNDHIIICGGGYIGKRIAHELTREGRPFIVVEPDEALMRWTLLYLDEEYRHGRFREAADFTFQMEDKGHEEMPIATLADELGIPYLLESPTSNAILVRAGIERAEGLFAVMGDDRDNLLVVLTARGLARELQKKDLRIIARTVEEENYSKLIMAGADRVLSANIVEAAQLTAHMLHPHTGALWRMTMDESSPLHYTEITVHQASGLDGKTCGEIKVSENYLIMSIYRDGQYINLPNPDQVCRLGDVLVVVTEKQ